MNSYIFKEEEEKKKRERGYITRHPNLATPDNKIKVKERERKVLISFRSVCYTKEESKDDCLTIKHVF